MEKKILKELIYKASPEKLWKAITEREEMKLWYFELDEFKPEVGYEFRFWEEPKKGSICTFV